MRHLDVWTDRAQMIGAVNVIRRRGDGALVGDNTDGAGFIEDLEERGHSIRGASFVIFGAGGAARALSVEVALLRPRSILVLNRSPDRLAQLMKIHEAAGHGIEVTGAQATHQFRVPAGTDFVVNATSLGMTPDNGMPDVDLESLREDTVVCDVVPNPADTPLLIAAGQRGCPTVDGRGMLIHQAAIAFRDWTGLPAPKAVMRAALDAALDVSGSNVSDSNTAKGTV